MKAIFKVVLLFVVVIMALPAASYALPQGDLLDGVAPGTDGMIDVVTVFAHPDDEVVYGGGTLIKLSRDPRVRIHVVCLTLGDMSEAKDRLKITPELLGRIRTQELETAASVYGAADVVQLGYRDQGLESADPRELASRIEEQLDEFGAEIVITHDPLGITGHPDHVACSAAAKEAFSSSRARRLYYVTYPRRLYWFTPILASGGKRPDPEYPRFKVNVAKERKLKKMAMYAHASQKHFSGVGAAMTVTAAFRWEWFALAEEKD